MHLYAIFKLILIIGDAGMFKLLIVEDEDFIRETIVTCIDWASIGFEVRDAEDGEAALAVAEGFKPDAVLTDIRMPIINGLELTAEIKSRYPDTLVVVLSGHDEFKYAQEAMNLGVLEYITKPILPKDFTAAMRKLHKQLSERKERQNAAEKLQIQLYQGMPLLRSRFFNHLITRRLTFDEIIEHSLILDINIVGAAFTVMLLSAQYENDASAEASELAQFALSNVLAEEMGPHCYLFNDAAGRLVMIYMDGGTVYEDCDFLLELAETLRLSNQYMLGCVITIAIGATVDDIGELGYSYDTAVIAFDQRLVPGIGRTLDYRDFTHLGKAGYVIFSHAETSANFSRGAEIVSLACGYISRSYNDPSLSLNGTAAQVFVSPVYLSMLFKRELGVTFIDYVTSMRLEQAKRLLEAGGIKNYEVAERVGYNDAQYFSNCFKKYTGVTPSEYRAAAKRQGVAACKKHRVFRIR